MKSGATGTHISPVHCSCAQQEMVTTGAALPYWVRARRINERSTHFLLCFASVGARLLKNEALLPGGQSSELPASTVCPGALGHVQ